VHGVGKDENKIGLKVWFRDIRLRKLQPSKSASAN
jgi:hypothetical protein